MPLPTQYVSNYGFLAVGLETTFGTPVTATDYFPFISETLETDPGVKPVATIRGTRAENSLYVMAEIKSMGGIVLPFGPANGARLLAAAIGADTTTHPSAYLHTMAPNEAGIPSLTVEKALSTLKSLQYTGCLVDKATFKLATDAEVEVTYDLVNQVDAQITPSSPSYSAETPFSLKDISFTVFGSSNANVESCDFTLDNGVKQKFTFTGHGYPTLNYSGGRKITGKITVLLQAMTDYSNAMAGTKGALVITMSQSGSASCVFTMPNIVWGKPSQPLKLGELITQDLPFTAFYTPGASYDISAALTNGVSSAYV